MTTALSRIHLPRNSSTPCVCGCCTCGTHRCPGVVEKIPFEGVTTYKVQFPAKATQHQRPYAPHQLAVSTPAQWNHFLTTNQTHAAVIDSSQPKVSPVIPQSTLHRHNAPFVGTTTQQSDYPRYEPTRRARSAQPRRAMEPIPSFGLFETTNSAMQGPVAAMMKSRLYTRPTPAIQQVTLVQSGAPLDGSTTYKEFYPPRKSVYERLFRARQQAIPAASLIDDRDFRTTKGTHYTAPPPITNPCPAIPFAKRPASADGHISMR